MKRIVDAFGVTAMVAEGMDTCKAMALDLDCSEHIVQRALRDARSRGWVQVVGTGRMNAFVYAITKAGEQALKEQS